MDEAKMKRAGEMADSYKWTDEELALMVEATSFVVAYFKARGPKWNLVLAPLRAELDSLKGFQHSRKNR